MTELVHASLIWLHHQQPEWLTRGYKSVGTREQLVQIILIWYCSKVHNLM